MPIDFGKLGGDSTDTALHPRELFTILPAKHPRYEYPRDVQTEVWNQWFDKRAARDLTIKMNTGSGKTTVGLLILKSCLNEGIRPAVYLAPNPQLAQQVMAEARDLGVGIEVTDDPRSTRFQSGREILVTSIYRVVNGKSVFGVADEGIQIPIGSVLIDDAHACLEASEEKFSLKIPQASGAFQKLFDLFYPDLEKQSFSRALDIKGGDSSKNMLVPFWVWQKKQAEIQAILRASSKDFEFSWPLLKQHLHLCQCAVSGSEIEIAPRCLPIEVIPSFQHAERRIYMSATVSDDSVLVTHFDVNPSSIEKPIVPSSSGDVGDRLILIPQELNPTLDDPQLKAYFHSLAQARNVVVLVPSDYRAAFWSDVAAETLRAQNLLDGIARLKRGHVGLVVLVNKYDGIDLPENACRVLVIDGLPDLRSRLDKIEQTMLLGSDEVIRRAIQRVEQGMGRGIRSNKDWCAVFLMGRSLTTQLYARNAKAHFTPATRAQLTFSEQLSKMLDRPGIKELDEVVQLFFGRDKGWVEKSRAAVIQARYATTANISLVAKCQRRGFNAAANRDFAAARAAMQEAIQAEQSPQVKGWLMQQLAEYIQFSNAVEAQHILRSAVSLNNQVVHPLDGVEYVRLPSGTANQASQALAYLRETFENPTAFVVTMYDHLDALVFKPDTSETFHHALAAIARVIGFTSQEPERDFGRGPDVLWNLGRQKFFVIEAKNGAVTNSINKHDCNQLNGSMHWFEEKYGDTCSAIPVMVHPSNVPEQAATLHGDTRIITQEGLTNLREALRNFALGIAYKPKYGTEAEVRALLTHHKLSDDLFLSGFTVKPRIKG